MAGRVDEDVAKTDEWRHFGLRDIPPMSARKRFLVPDRFVPLLEERLAELQRPFVGITTDGASGSDLRDLDDAPRVDTRPIADAASAFLQSLTPEQRDRATFPIDAPEWRQWINVHMNFYRHGVMLDDLPAASRELALGLLRATLSARGFGQARAIMLINELIVDVTGDTDAFGEWLYFISFFGSPASNEPWGWQIDGHHLCLNIVIVDGRIVTTPSFMGSEPRSVHTGPYAGLSLFDPEEMLGLSVVRSLDPAQLARAVVRPSIHTSDIPERLQHPFDGRMEAGGAHDNVIAPYQGIRGSDLSDGQRRLVRDLAAVYVGWAADEPARLRLAEVEAHLDDTWFSWYGGISEDSVFYYRVHSPVILIEFDHHPGLVFDNLEPSRHHVHTLVRTPNGGDYGTDLLRRHYERYEHTNGRHRER